MSAKIRPHKSRQESLAFVALGCNDIRYRDGSICAMSEEEYIKSIDKIVTTVDAKIFVLITPWMSAGWDEVCRCAQEEKMDLYKKYSESLKKYCKERSLIFIDPQRCIWASINRFGEKKYLCDYIHPTAADGIELYCSVVCEELSNCLKGKGT